MEHINATRAFRILGVHAVCAHWPIETLKGKILILRLRIAFISSIADLCPGINIEYKALRQEKVAWVIRAWPTTVCGPRCFSEHLGCGPKEAGAHKASTSTNPCGTFGVHDRLKPTKHRQPQIVGTLSESRNFRGPRTLTYLQMLASGVQETSGSINLGATLCPRASVVRRRDVHES